MLLVDDNGQAIGAPTQCDYNFRLPPTANYTVINGKAVVYSGEENTLDKTQKLLRIEFALAENQK